MSKLLAILVLTLTVTACSAEPALDGTYQAFYTQEDSLTPRCQELPNEPLLLTEVVELPDLGGACEVDDWYVEDDGTVWETMTCRIGNAYVETVSGVIHRLGDGVLSWTFELSYAYAFDGELICRGYYDAKLVPLD